MTLPPNPGRPSKRIALVCNSTWALYNFRLDVLVDLLAATYEIVLLAPKDEFAPSLVALGCLHVPIQFDNRGENPFQDIHLYLQLRRLYRKLRPDFVFHYVVKPNIYGTLAAQHTGIPSVAVVTGLGYSFAKKNWLHRVVRSLYRIALRSAVEVWFLNKDDAKIFIREKILNIEKMKILPGEGVNPGFFKRQQRLTFSPNKPFTFLMSARLLNSKGLNVLADASRILKQRDVVFRCILIGFFEKNHPDSVSEEGLNKWQAEGLLEYHGFAKDVRPYLEQADCFVFPSFYPEGIPRSLLEAASMELPIITAVNTGCKEVVLDQVNGFLCQPNDPFDLAEKMVQMMRISDEQRVQMGQKGRERVIQNFSVDRVVREYHRVLDSFWSPAVPSERFGA